MATTHALATAQPGEPIPHDLKAYDHLNEKIEPGSRGYGIPDPAIYIVDARGMIRARLAAEDYRKRPPATEIIAAIARLMN